MDIDIPSIIPTPNLHLAKRILAIQPHYDDNDIGAGGTLAALHDAGAEIIYLTVTNDVAGVIDTTISDEEAIVKLHAEQYESGKAIGVSRQAWLEYPDSGCYDYYELRRKLIGYIRLLKPDFIFTPDPWLPYEAHRDHIQTGTAAAEAAVLYDLMRIKSDPEIDAQYERHELMGIAFYYPWKANTPFDVSQTQERKAQAIRCYHSQFTPEAAEMLLMAIDAKERMMGESIGCTHAEAFKVMHPRQLHCGL